MNATLRIGTWMAFTLAAVAAGADAAQAAAPAQDQLYASARLESRQPMTVAVLPAVTTAHDPQVERRVEASWVALYAGAKTRWVPAHEVRTRIAQASGASDIATRAEREVWLRGALEPVTAAGLARLLGVDAVLSLRVDRWEIVDGGRATVEMSATLTDADGTRLWSISGFAGHGRPPGSREQNFNADLTWIVDPTREPRPDQAGNPGRALYKLLARWAGSLPGGPMFEDGEGAPALLTLNADD